MEDNHIFGEKDYLDGNEYADGSTISVKVLGFLGRQPYLNFDGEEEKAGYFKVQNPKGVAKEFRLGISNEIILKKKFGITSYGALIGKTLTLGVKKYTKGNGFIVVDLKA